MDRNNREDGWMDGWMDGYMDGWMDGYMDGWMDGWMELERFCRLRFSINNWAMMHQSCFFLANCRKSKKGKELHFV